MADDNPIDIRRANGLSDDVIARLIDHLKHDTTDLAPSDLRVPVANYTDDAYAAKERALIASLPVVVAHASQVRRPGQFVTRDVMGLPLLIVRQDNGQAAVFRNRCRHRGGKVETQAAGERKTFTCAYHGWTYGADGALRGVPFEASYEPIDRACNGLIHVKSEERHGFIWAQLSNEEEPRSVAEFLGPEADAQLGSFGLDGATVFLNESYTLDINWKIVLDGALDIIHQAFLHPETVGKLIQANACVWKDYGRHGQLFAARKRLAEMAKSGEAYDVVWRNFVTNMFVFPNNLVITAPDHVEFWTVWPAKDSASKSVANIRFLVRPEILDEAMTQRLNRSWAILKAAALTEDFPMEATIQANSDADPSGAYLYGRSEISCQHLHRQLRAALGDA